MLPIYFGPGIHLCNTTEFHLYLTEDNGPWVNVFKKIITVFQDNHAKPQNAFCEHTQNFTH